MKTPITSLPSLDASLVASGISRPDKIQISIQPLQDLGPITSTLTSKIEFQNGESVQSYKWLKSENPAYQASSSGSKKRKNSLTSKASNDNKNDNNDKISVETIEFIDYLVILLSTGEILIYSTLTKEFVNKISTDSPFSSIDVINKFGYPKKSLYKYDYDIITFDSETSSLKMFSSTSPQLIDSIQFKNDPSITYILFNPAILKSSENNEIQTELYLASNSTLYLVNNHHDVIDTIDISLPMSSSNKNINSTQNSADANNKSILKIIEEDSKLYIIRSNCSFIQVIDLNVDKKKNHQHVLFTTTNNITDISILKTDNSKVLSASLIGGAIELFKLNSKETSSYARLEIEGGKDVGKFVGLFNSNGVINEVYKGIWYDNFNVQITDFEFENILKLENKIQISVTEQIDNEMLDLVDDDGDDDDINNSNIGEYGDDHNKEMDSINDSEISENFKCSGLQQLSNLIKPRLEDATKENIFDESFPDILSQNVTFAKQLIYTLSIDESNILFAKISYIISQYSNSSQGFTISNNVKNWLKWLLILRGSVLSQNEESVEWLKLLQSEFTQESKILNNMIKLTGKLSLLRDQLTVRNEMMKKHITEEEGNDDDKNNSDDYDEDDLQNGNNDTTLDGASVVLDGEGGFDEDDEDEDDDEDDDEDEEEIAETDE